MSTLFSLEGDVALVTGASSGLGRHFAGTLAKAGAKVILSARREEALQAAWREVLDAGRHAAAVPMDVTDPDSVSRGLGQAEAAFGPITVLINNAGLAIEKPLGETLDDDWDRVMAVNLDAAFRLARDVSGRMIAAGMKGSIVNIASILGQTATSKLHAYEASKAGLIQLTKSLAVELARHKIRVNAISPGYIRTDLNKELLDGPVGDHLKKRTPMRRFAAADELDGALLLLCSDAGSYMTGSVVVVDGGLTLSTL